MAALAPTAPPGTTCLGCTRPIPAGLVWCSWLCRGLDDRHDTTTEASGE